MTSLAGINSSIPSRPPAAKGADPAATTTTVTDNPDGSATTTVTAANGAVISIATTPAPASTPGAGSAGSTGLLDLHA